MTLSLVVALETSAKKYRPTKGEMAFEPWIVVKWSSSQGLLPATTQLQRRLLKTASPYCCSSTQQRHVCLFCRFASNHFPGDATLLQVLDLLRSDNKEVGDLRLCAFAAYWVWVLCLLCDWGKFLFFLLRHNFDIAQSELWRWYRWWSIMMRLFILLLCCWVSACSLSLAKCEKIGVVHVSKLL